MEPFFADLFFWMMWLRAGFNTFQVTVLKQLLGVLTLSVAYLFEVNGTKNVWTQRQLGNYYWQKEARNGSYRILLTLGLTVAQIVYNTLLKKLG